MSNPSNPLSPRHVVAFPDAGSRPKLLDRVRHFIRMRHYSRRTESAYVHWIRRFIFFHNKKHPATMGAAEITAFLSSLATRQRVSASTQNQALSALLFLYRHVLRMEIGALEPVTRAKIPHRLPVVLTPQEVAQVLKHLDGPLWLVVALLYGAGLRLKECLELRVKGSRLRPARNHRAARQGPEGPGDDAAERNRGAAGGIPVGGQAAA